MNKLLIATQLKFRRCKSFDTNSNEERYGKMNGGGNIEGENTKLKYFQYDVNTQRKCLRHRYYVAQSKYETKVENICKQIVFGHDIAVRNAVWLHDAKT